MIYAIIALIMIKCGAEELTTTIGPLICNPRSFRLDIPDKIVWDRAAKILVRNKKDEECSKNPRYIWTVYQLNTDQQPQQTTYVKIDNVLDFEGPTDKTENSFLISKADASVSFYLYEFQMSVQLIPAAGWNPWYQNKTFQIHPYPLVAVIRGGAYRDHVLGTGDLILDGTGSYDKSYREKGPEALLKNDISWKCSPPISTPWTKSLIWTIPENDFKGLSLMICALTIERKTTPFFPQRRTTKQTITIIKPKTPVIQLTCLENCQPAEAAKRSKLFGLCLKHCLNEPFQWTFSPFNEESEQGLVSRRDGSLIIMPNTFRPGDAIKFEMRLADASQTLTLNYRIPEPKLVLKCRDNCQYDPRRETVVELACLSDCVNLDPSWEISSGNLNPEWLSSDKVILTLKSNVFNDGDNVIVTVTSYNSIATLDITFDEPVPKLAIRCGIMDEMKTDCATANPDPRDVVTLTVTCVTNCDFLNFTWIIDPEPSGFDVEENVNPPIRDVLTITANTFADQQDVTVTVTTGKTSILFNTTYIIKIPQLVIECVSNCDEPGKTEEEMQLKPVCLANCSHLDYVWAVNNHSPLKVKTWTDDGSLLTIPPGNLIDGNNTFILNSGKASAKLIKLFQVPIPQISITCEANCGKPNPGKETILKVTCTSPPHVCNVPYQWSIAPLPQNFSWIERTTLNEQQTILILKPNTFRHNETIGFNVTDGKKAQAELTLNYQEPAPQLSIICEKNCHPSHPGYVTELKVVCVANCESSYQWDFDPKPRNPIKDIETYKDTVFILADAYQDGNTVNITVKSGRGTVSFPITYKKIPPILMLSCTPPCTDIHDPMDPITVNATCITYCSKSFEFTWEIEPKKYDASKIIFQRNKDSFLILPGTFESGEDVNVTVSTESGNEVTTTLTFLEMQPELAIECVSNCWEASPLNETILKAVCLDNCKNVETYQWELEPAPSKPITYSPKNITITIKPETYQDLDIVNVTINARNGNQTQQLKFLELAPVLIATCLTNCNPSNPFEDVVLGVNCIKYCLKIHYEWVKIEPPPGSSPSLDNTNPEKINATLTIGKNSFKDGDAHRFFVNSRKGSAYVDVHFITPSAELQLICMSNCPIANPLENVEIQATCVKYCYEDYKWSLIPLADKVTEIKGPNNTLTIPNGTYPDQGSVRVKIFTNKSAEFLDVYFVEPTPVLELMCSNCVDHELNPFDDSIFNVTCLQFCEHLNYTWDFSPKSSNAIYENEEKESAIVPKLTFDNGQELLVMVNSGKGKAEITVIYRTPPGYIVIGCVNNNCPYSSPLQPVVLNLSCFYNCSDQPWLWDIEPHDPNFNWTQHIEMSNDNVTLTINQGTFVDGQVVQLHAWSDREENLTNLTVLKFEEPTPNVTIVCVENCDPFNCQKDVIVEAKCWENCEQLVLEWTLDPKSFHVDLANNSESKFKILAGSYYFNETVNVLLKARKGRVNMTIVFAPAGWDGVCDFEPLNGTSGVTLFSIGCDYFQDGVIYRIYQDYPGVLNKLGVMLTYGDSKFSDFVYLSAGKSMITVVVGNGFENKKRIRLKPERIRSLPESKTEELLGKILGEELDEFTGMVNSRIDTDKTIQFASLLWTAVNNTNGTHVTHFTKHIIAGVNHLTSRIEPTQLLSLYSKFITRPAEDMLTVRLMMEGIRGVVQHMISVQNQPIYQNNETLPGFCYETLSLLSALQTQTTALYRTLPKPMPNNDYPLKFEFVPFRAEYRRDLRKFTHDLLATTEAFLNIAQPNATLSKMINLRTGEFSAMDAKIPNQLNINGSKSYIMTSPKFSAGLEAANQNFTYIIGLFVANPFWWQSPRINTDVIQFSTKYLPGPITVHLRVKKPVTGNFSGTLSNQMIYEFAVKPQSLFSATFVKIDNAYRVYTFPKWESTVVNATETLNYETNDENYLYLLITVIQSGNTSYAAKYKMLECFAWSSNYFAASKSGCRAFEHEANFLSCECRHASHFAGRLSVPAITNQTTDTMEFQNFANNLLVPVTIGIVLIIFILLAMFAHYRDVREKSKGIIFLDDNQPGDCELYLLIVATGLNSGTTSDVAIELVGAEAKSRVHLLQSESSRNLTGPNGEHLFALYAEKNLGELTGIRLWINSKGRKPGWFCERVMIEHLPSRSKYLFIIERWFSLLDGDGTTEGTFPAATKTTLRFPQRLRETIRENNHLLTLFTQRPRAVNKETVMIGYATCSFAMLAALMLIAYTPEIPILPTAAIAAAVAIPITFLLNNLFRNSP